MSNYCKIIAPAPKFLGIHQEILNKIDARLAVENIPMIETNTHLVMAVNSSRMAADIERDIAKVGKETLYMHAFFYT